MKFWNGWSDLRCNLVVWFACFLFYVVMVFDSEWQLAISRAGGPLWLMLSLKAAAILLTAAPLGLLCALDRNGWNYIRNSPRVWAIAVLTALIAVMHFVLAMAMLFHSRGV